MPAAARKALGGGLWGAPSWWAQTARPRRALTALARCPRVSSELPLLVVFTLDGRAGWCGFLPVMDKQPGRRRPETVGGAPSSSHRPLVASALSAGAWVWSPHEDCKTEAFCWGSCETGCGLGVG